MKLPVFNYQVNNTDEAIDVYIDGQIVDSPTQELLKEWWGDNTSISLKSVRDQVNKPSVKKINFYVNSGGGQVTEAMAIHDLILDLKNKGIEVNTYGRGIIASAATYILMAGHENSDISKNGWFMIHNVSGFAYGDVNEVEKQARILRKFNNSIRDFYSDRTGIPKEDIEDMMNHETWMTGEEAVKKGFVKNLSGEAIIKNKIDPKNWLYSNTAVLNAYNANIKSDDMNTQEITNRVIESVKKALNLDKKEPLEDQIKNAISDSLKESLKDVPSKEEVKNIASVAIKEALNEGGELHSFVNDSLRYVQDSFNKEISSLKEDLASKLTNYNNKATEDTKGEFEHEGVSWE